MTEQRHRVMIIAEAGVNHNGSLTLAKQMVDIAAACGADAVKFQTFRSRRLVTRSAGKARYQRVTTDKKEPQWKMLRRLELGPAEHEQLIRHCHRRDILFLSSPFDERSADLLVRLRVPILKIPSGELTNHPFLAHCAEKGRPLILSTGMSTLGEVEEALNAIKRSADVPVTLLHCVTEYPAPYDQVNLRAMLTLREAFGLPVGYSDHTAGNEIALAAVAMGAVIIEKHFTLSREMKGPDHRASLEPSELASLVTAIRHVEAAFGDGVKRPARCEIDNMKIARKSIVARRVIPRGKCITKADLDIKRPGTGIPPGLRDRVIGLVARRRIEADSPLQWKFLS